MDSIPLDQNHNLGSIHPLHQESMTSNLNPSTKTEAENNSRRPTHPLSSSFPNHINTNSQSNNSLNHSNQSIDSQSQSIPSTSSSNPTSIHQSLSSISNTSHHHPQEEEEDDNPSPTPSPILSSLSLFNHSHPSNSSSYRLSPLIQGVDEADIQSLFHQLDSHDPQSGNVTQSISLDKGKGREVDMEEEENGRKDSLDYKTISNQLAQISRSVQDPNQKSQLDHLVSFRQTSIAISDRSIIEFK